MKTIMWGVFIVSVIALLLISFKHKVAVWKGLILFFLHGVVAFVLLYMINTTNWIPEVHVPTNPLTLAIVGCLGLPGLASILFLQMSLF